jgi:4-amino-4-deoxy-L-arabinose transferase-like glycosyltransferase
MIKKEFKYALILAGVAFGLCLPMLFFDELPARDVITRYAPMAEAFAAGECGKAFNTKIPPLLPVLAGIIVYLLNVSGAMACKIISALFFALTVFPLTALFSKVFNVRYAFWAGAMYILCSRLMRIAGTGVRDTAKCFFIVLATYGLICFFRRYNWKGALYCSLGSVGLALNRGDSLLFALLFLMAIVFIEMFKQRNIPYKSVCAGIVFLIAISPWCLYEYHHTGWLVTEVRHAMVVDKLLSGKTTIVAPANSKVITAAPKKVKISPSVNIRNNDESFWENLFKGFYPQYLFFIIPVLFFRIRKKKILPEEIILLLVVMIHAAGMILQIAIADKRIFIYKRYLIVATPLMFGWGAIGARWVYDNIRQFLSLKYRWICRLALCIIIFIFVLDGWARIRKKRINPFLYKQFQYYTGINLDK